MSLVPSLLTDEEKVRVRFHTGYLNVSDAQSFALGLPAGVQTQFLIEGAMDKLMPSGLPLFREHLAILDGIIAQMVGDLELLAVESIATINVRLTEQKELTERYIWFRSGLCNMLGILPNPYDMRFGGGGTGTGINVSVLH
jgi:hypothetical protein